VAAIEPVIGHLKNDCSFCRNYLKGIQGDNMNLVLAAAAMNFKRRMNPWHTDAPGRRFLKPVFDIYRIFPLIKNWLFEGQIFIFRHYN
jgi:hypothetical protein